MSRNSQISESACKSASLPSIRAVVTRQISSNQQLRKILITSSGPELQSPKLISIRTNITRHLTLTSWLAWRISSKEQALHLRLPDLEHRAVSAAGMKWYLTSGRSRISSKRRKTKSLRGWWITNQKRPSNLRNRWRVCPHTATASPAHNSVPQWPVSSNNSKEALVSYFSPIELKNLFHPLNLLKIINFKL